jgi:hypothetical protein
MSKIKEKKYPKWKLLVPLVLFTVLMTLYALNLVERLLKVMDLTFLMEIILFVVLFSLLIKYYEFYGKRTK